MDTLRFLLVKGVESPLLQFQGHTPGQLEPGSEALQGGLLPQQGQPIREAEKCRETGEAKTILFGLTGTGYFDMVAYDRYNRGEMEDHVPIDEELEAGFATIPSIPGIQ